MMDFSKKLIALTVYFLLTNITIFGSQRRNLNLIFIIDTKEERMAGPLTNDFAVALKQKAAPIIISENVLYNFFALRESITPQALQELRETIKKNEIWFKEIQFQSEEAFNPEEIKKIDVHFKTSMELSQKKYDSIMKLIAKLNNIPPLSADSLEPLQRLTSMLQSYLGQLSDDSSSKGMLQKILVALQTLPRIIKDYLEAEKNNPQDRDSIFLRNKEQSKRIIDYSTQVAYIHAKLRELVVLATREKEKESYGAESEFNLALTAQQVALSEKMSKLREKQNKILTSLPRLKAKQTVLFYSDISFQFSEWLIFKHATAPFYILIPKSVIAESEKALMLMRTIFPDEEKKGTTEIYTDQEQAVGLAFNHPSIMKPLPLSIISEKALLQFMQEHMTFKIGIEALRQSSWMTTESYIKIAPLKQCFISKNDLMHAFWNIYMIGHGMYKKTVTIAQKLQFLKHSMDEATKTGLLLKEAISSLSNAQGSPTSQDISAFNNEMNRLFIAYLVTFDQNIFDPNDETAGAFLIAFIEEQPLITDLIKQHKIDPIIHNPLLLRNFLEGFEKQVQQQWQQLSVEKERLEAELKSGRIIESAPIIAGLSLNQQRDFLRFLNQSVNTSFLYMITCFGGGFNAEQIRQYAVALEQSEKKMLGDFSSSFIIAIGALTDAAVYSFNLDNRLIPLNFTGFFKDLKKFFLKEDPFKKDPIITILNNVLIRAPSGAHRLTDVPLVYIPGTHLMRATEIDNEIMVITQAKLKALELIIPKKKEKVAPIITKGKSALLFYPTTITVPVVLGVDSREVATALVPMTPGASSYQFTMINTGTIDLNKFLRESIIDVRSVMPRTFIIDELECANYKDSGLPENAPLQLYNVVIQSTITQLQYSESIEWNIVFATLDKDKKEIFYHGTIQESYKDPKNFKDRIITQSTWKKISKQEIDKIILKN